MRGQRECRNGTLLKRKKKVKDNRGGKRAKRRSGMIVIRGIRVGMVKAFFSQTREKQVR